MAELQGVEAELVDSSAGRGVAGGHGNGDGGDRSIRWCCGERDRGGKGVQRVREK